MRLGLAIVIIGFAVLAVFDLIDRVELSRSLQVEELLSLRASYLKDDVAQEVFSLLKEEKIDYGKVLKLLKDSFNYKMN